MNHIGAFETLLRDAIGLDATSIGRNAIERVVRERASLRTDGDTDAYWVTVCNSADERQALIEAVVIPETWFFRDPGAFVALTQLARERWLSTQASDRKLTVLSIPCSTGEEPYSIAMALIEAGVPASRMRVEAVDVSTRALAAAQVGHYRKNSFRGTDLAFRDRFFKRVPEGYDLVDNVREAVHFREGNLLDPALLGEGRYDIVFCRNLLIYFDRPTQDRAAHALSRLLCDTGTLFVGPSETGLMMNHAFVPANWPGAFAFSKPQPARAPKALSASPPRRVTHVRAPRQAFAPPARPLVTQATATTDRVTKLLDEAEALANRGELEEARRLCSQFIRTPDANARGFYLMGLLEDSSGDAATAIGHYRRVLYLEPDSHEAMVHLAVLLDRSGDHRGASRLLERAKRASTRSSGT